MVVAVRADVVESLRAKFAAVLPHLDERQQRLVLAGEARSLGHGGIAAVAQASGASRSRISQGVAELEAGEVPLGRVRREGGGRKPLTATDPALLAALLALVEPDPARGPLLAVVLDDAIDPQAGRRTDRRRSPGRRGHGGPAAAGAGIQPASQRQNHRGRPAFPTGMPSSATSTTRPMRT